MTQTRPPKTNLFNRNADLLHGPIFKNLLLFMLPILVSNLFQQLYNTVDTMIVGKLLGAQALAAVGSTGSINFFVIGFCMLLFSRNLIKKVIGLDIMDSGVFLLLADRGYIAGRTAPIIVDGVTDMSRYVNPIPAGLVLTGIVVSVSVSAVMLSLTVRIYKTYHTLDVDKLYMMISHKKKRRDRR